MCGLVIIIFINGAVTATLDLWNVSRTLDPAG